MLGQEEGLASLTSINNVRGLVNVKAWYIPTTTE